MRRSEATRHGLLGGLLLLALAVAPSVTRAATVDVTGTWNLTVNDPSLGCTWAGQMFLTQTGTFFTGSATLDLVAGSGMCIPVINGALEGSISGSGSGFIINFGLASGSFGSASFKGVISDDGLSAMGDFENNASGTWSADKVPAHPAPTLGGFALATLFGLLTVAGVVSVRRRAA